MANSILDPAEPNTDSHQAIAEPAPVTDPTLTNHGHDHQDNPVTETDPYQANPIEQASQVLNQDGVQEQENIHPETVTSDVATENASENIENASENVEISSDDAENAADHAESTKETIQEHVNLSDIVNIVIENVDNLPIVADTNPETSNDNVESTTDNVENSTEQVEYPSTVEPGLKDEPVASDPGAIDETVQHYIESAKFFVSFTQILQQWGSKY